jgi:hypothetical protein
MAQNKSATDNTKPAPAELTGGLFLEFNLQLKILVCLEDTSRKAPFVSHDGLAATKLAV